MKRFLAMLLIALSTATLSNHSMAAPIVGEVNIYDPAGTPLFPPTGTPVSGDLDLGAGTMTVDPFLFFGSLLQLTVVELLGPGPHTRPGNIDGTQPIIITVNPDQLGAYIRIDWAINTFATFMVWDINSHATGSSYTTIDSDGDGIPGHALVSGPFPGFSITYDFIEGESPPDVEVAIDVEGGSPQECAETDGNTVTLNAEITLVGGAVLDSVFWTVDGDDAGTGPTISPFLTLGTHAVEAMAIITTGQTDTAAEIIEVRDTTKPEIEVAFIDNKSGDPVTSTSKNIKVITSLIANDICDSTPVTEGTIVPVHTVNDGDIIHVKKKGKVKMPVTALELTGIASDASGNRNSDMTVLKLAD